MNGEEQKKAMTDEGYFRGVVMTSLKNIEDKLESHTRLFDMHTELDNERFEKINKKTDSHGDKIKFFKAWLAGAVFVVGGVIWFIEFFL